MISFHKISQLLLPFFCSIICFTVTYATKGDKVSLMIIAFVVINMMHVKRSGLFLMLSAKLASVIVSFSDFRAKRGAKLFWIANIKTFAPFATKFYTVWAVHSIVAPFNKAFCFGYWLTATGASNSNSIVMPVIFASSYTGFRKKFAFTFFGAKKILNSFDVPLRALDFRSAVRTFFNFLFAWLRPCPMTINVFSRATAFIKWNKNFTATAATFYQLIFISVHNGILSQNLSSSKTSLGA